MENAATEGTIGKDGTFVPFVMMWAESIPSEILFGPKSNFSEAPGSTKIFPDDLDGDGGEVSPPGQAESSVTYSS